MRWRAAPVAVLAALALAASSADAATGPATLTGKLAGAKLPARGQGRIPVQLMSLKTGEIVDAGYASLTGRFTLRGPAGSYAVLAAIVPRRGRALVERVADFVTARAGVRRVLRPTLRKRKRRRVVRRATTRPTARASFVQLSSPVITIARFVGTSRNPEVGVMQEGVAAMLDTDISEGIHARPCRNAVLVERRRFGEVLTERALQNSPYFDASQRTNTRELYGVNTTITGTVGLSGGQWTVTANYFESRTGYRATVTKRAGNIFGAEAQVAAELLEKHICRRIVPRIYNGTFNGTYRSDLNKFKVTWSGTVTIELLSEHGDAPTDGPPGDYARYVVRTGRVHAVLDGTRNGASQDSCTAHGEADFDLAPGVASGEDRVQRETEQPWYSINVAARGDESIPYTETGSGCQSDASYPLTGVQFAYTPKPLQSADGTNLTANTAWDQYGYSHFTSQFSFIAGD